MSQKCIAHKRNGEPCGHYAIEGLTVCKYHGGATKAAKAKARRLLDSSAMPAVVTLINILTDVNTPIALREKTAIDLLDRVPGFAKNSHVETSNPVLEGVFKSIFKPVDPGTIDAGEIESMPGDSYSTPAFIDRTMPDDVQEEFAAAAIPPQPSFEDLEVRDAEVVGPDPMTRAEAKAAQRDTLPKITPTGVRRPNMDPPPPRWKRGA